jgi:hypothetical protein
MISSVVIVLGVEALVVLGLQFRFVRFDALEIRVQEHRNRYSVVWRKLNILKNIYNKNRKKICKKRPRRKKQNKSIKG